MLRKERAGKESSGRSRRNRWVQVSESLFLEGGYRKHSLVKMAFAYTVKTLLAGQLSGPRKRGLGSVFGPKFPLSSGLPKEYAELVT